MVMIFTGKILLSKQYFALVAIRGYHMDDDFGLYLFACHPQYPITVLEVEIYFAGGEMGKKRPDQLVCLVIFLYIGFKNFNCLHCKFRVF